MQKHALFWQNIIYCQRHKKKQIINSLFYLSLSETKGEQNKKGFLIGLMQYNFTWDQVFDDVKLDTRNMS